MLFPHLKSILSGLFHRSRTESSMAEEMRFHIEAYAAGLVRSGVPLEEARRRARMEFGGIEVVKDQCREALGLRLLDDLKADLRYAARTLANSPSFSITAILTMALGIGANTGLFTVMDTLVLRPVNVPDPWSLYQVYGQTGDRMKFAAFSRREYADLASRNAVFTQLSAGIQIRAILEGQRLGGFVVSGNYFQQVGAVMALGRPIVPEDDLPAAPPVVVLGYDRWQQTFNSDPGIVGRTIVLSGHRFTVIGVAARKFTGIDPLVPDFWAPLTAEGLFAGGASRVSIDPGERSLRLLGRLRPGVTAAQAESAMSALLPAVTESRQREMRFTGAILESRATYQSWNHANYANIVPVVTAFALILLIACGNLSNVLLARGLNRQREIGVRLSLGASRGRIVRQLVTETAVLSLLAGAVGLVISDVSWTLIRRVTISIFSRKTGMSLVEIHPDWRVLFFTLLLALGTGVVFGLAPALHAARCSLNSTLKAEGAWSRGSRMRDVLVVAQFALSLVLLIGAGLLLHSTIRFAAVRPGFEIAHTLSIEPVQETFHGTAALMARLKDRLEAVPGTRVVAAAMRQPLRGSLPRAHVLTGSPRSQRWEANYNEVTPEYFTVLEIPLVRGRVFRAEEVASGAAVAVVSQATAKRFWPDEDPLGKSLEISTADYSSGGRELLLTSTRTVQVIGVAKDVVSAWLSDGTDPTCVYLPAKAANAPYYALLARVNGDPRKFVPVMQSTLASIDPSTQFDVQTMAELIDLQILPFRFASWGAAALGSLGLLLASIGIYGVMAYMVSRRTREIGIRMALGADRPRVLWMTLREGLRLIAIAVVCGIVVSFGLSRVMRAMLFRVGASDPFTFVVAPMVLGAVGLLAIYFPCRKATRTDPNVALRFE